MRVISASLFIFIALSLNSGISHSLQYFNSCKNILTEALQMIMKFAKENLQNPVILLRVMTENEESKALALKNGFFPIILRYPEKIHFDAEEQPKHLYWFSSVDLTQ